MRITPTGETLGATVEGADLAKPLNRRAFAAVPRRAGVALGGTEFANMHAAYAALPEELKTRLDGMTVLHDFNKFWEMMRQRPGSLRPPLSAEQRKKKPPVSHPIFLTHPIP